MKSLPVIILLFLSIVVALNSKKIGELAKSNIAFRYILLICMIAFLGYIGFTLFSIFTK